MEQPGFEMSTIWDTHAVVDDYMLCYHINLSDSFLPFFTPTPFFVSYFFLLKSLLCREEERQKGRSSVLRFTAGVDLKVSI